MKDKVNLAAKLTAFDQYFSPKIVGQLNDYKLQPVKVKGRVRMALAPRYRRLLPRPRRAPDDPAPRPRHRTRPWRTTRPVQAPAPPASAEVLCGSAEHTRRNRK
jgi:hypothetical protein